MTTSNNPIVTPNFASHGKPTWLTTGLLNTAETPWADDRIQVSLSNIPLDDGRGGFQRVNFEELVWLCAGVALKQATPEEIALPAVQRLITEFKETPPVELRASVELSYGAHDVSTFEDLEKTPGLVENLGTDIVGHIKAGRMHVITISGKAMPTGSEAVALDSDANPIELKPETETRPATYKYTRVRRPHSYYFNVHDLWRAHFEDASMSKPGTRIRTGRDGRRFAGQVMVKDLIGDGKRESLALVMGIMPDDDCGRQIERVMKDPKARKSYLRRSLQDHLRPGYLGKGRIFLLDPAALILIRGTILRLQVDVLPSWLELNPSPMPRSAEAREAAPAQAPAETAPTTATIGEVAAAKANKKNRRSSKKKDRAASAKDAAPVGDTSPKAAEGSAASQPQAAPASGTAPEAQAPSPA